MHKHYLGLVTRGFTSYYLKDWTWSTCQLHIGCPAREFAVVSKLGILPIFIDSTLILIPSKGIHEKIHEFENWHQEKEWWFNLGFFNLDIIL